jgi:hypothetical protein
MFGKGAGRDDPTPALIKANVTDRHLEQVKRHKFEDHGQVKATGDGPDAPERDDSSPTGMG